MITRSHSIILMQDKSSLLEMPFIVLKTVLWIAKRNVSDNF